MMMPTRTSVLPPVKYSRSTRTAASAKSSRRGALALGRDHTSGDPAAVAPPGRTPPTAPALPADAEVGGMPPAPMVESAPTVAADAPPAPMAVPALDMAPGGGATP